MCLRSHGGGPSDGACAENERISDNVAGVCKHIRKLNKERAPATKLAKAERRRRRRVGERPKRLSAGRGAAP